MTTEEKIIKNKLGRLRLVVTRSGETDAMTLKAESPSHEPALAQAIGDTLRAVFKLGGAVDLVPPGSLPNDARTRSQASSMRGSRFSASSRAIW